VRHRIVLDLRPRVHPANSSVPAEYDGALFFSDYSRDCIWAMLAGGDDLPDPSNCRTVVAGASNPAELQFGPGGDLYHVGLEDGNTRRIRSVTTNRAPVARATATPPSGTVPLTVAFDGSACSDPEGSQISYAGARAAMCTRPATSRSRARPHCRSTPGPTWR
jgi:hypothetical protein